MAGQKLSGLLGQKFNEKVIEIASILKPMLQAGATIAYESLNDTTLKNVRRSNISIEKFNKVREHVKSKGLKTHTDVILGLPGETKNLLRWPKKSI